MKSETVLIAGPTASGKSLAALALAEAVGGAIINADSMQVYRELRILTARPSTGDTMRVPHLLYGHVSVREPYSVGRYLDDATRALEEVREMGRVPIFVGGTGLYFMALTEGIADIPPIPSAVRDAVAARFEDLGHERFHAELASRDPEMAQTLRPSDRQRLLRAYEVLEATGRSLADWQRTAGRPVLKQWRATKVVLDVPRSILRERIGSRFRAMVQEGALEEAAALAELDPRLPAAKALGLRELNKAGLGKRKLEDAVAVSIVRTGQYAKRQETWFRGKMRDWPRLGPTDPSNFVTEMLRRDRIKLLDLDSKAP